ncbi:MAG: hypothetical protein JO247_22005 [Chloroflexi bacterium]|nr:hypothetical protein [Chloroflexota bacterium]
MSLLVALVCARGALAASPSPAEQSCGQTSRIGNVLVLDCAPGFASDHDRVTMASRTPLDPNQPWPAVLNYRDALWLFDIGATGNPQLVVNFHRAGSGLQADLYDASSSSQGIYRLLSRFPSMIGQLHPQVQVQAPDGWWTRDGKINFNLNVQVSGKIMGAFGAERFLDWQTSGPVPQFTIQVRDTDGDGRPDAEVIQVTPQAASPADGIFRTETLVDEGHNEPALSGYWFWPFLGFGQPGKNLAYDERQGITGQNWPCTVVKDYQESLPPIWVDAQKGTVECVDEFVASRGNGNNWFSYSMTRLGDNPDTTADWESPFAFYDLAGRGDGYPDTQIRVVNWNPQDIYADCASCNLDRPVQLVRYSWDDLHDHAWNYKLDLIGRHPLDQTISILGLTFRSVSYAQLPSWVANNSWDVTAFVAAEQPNYWTSEGIYTWDAPQDVWSDYLTGVTSAPPVSEYHSIDPGFRGEYTLQPQAKPRLYFSPIDHRLHLLGAQGGVWNDTRSLTTYDTLGTPYIARWTQSSVVPPTDVFADNQLLHIQPQDLSDTPQASEAATTQTSLTFMDGQLILEQPFGVSIKALDLPPSVAEFDPPTDFRSWTALGDYLTAHPAGSRVSSPEGMFEQFGGSVEIIAGGAVSGLRTDGDGFRFDLTTPLDVPWLGIPAAGRYVVRYSPAAGYKASAAQAVALAATSFTSSGSDVTALTPVTFSLTITNAANDDAVSEPVTLLASRGSAAPEAVAQGIVDVNSGAVGTVKLDWAPPVGGAWSVAAVVGGKTAAQRTLDVRFAPATSLAALLPHQLPLASERIGTAAVLGGALLLTAILAAFAVGQGPRE